MSNLNETIEAWRNPDFRDALSPALALTLPASPAGTLDCLEAYLKNYGGSGHGKTTDEGCSFSFPFVCDPVCSESQCSCYQSSCASF
jgi:mersacidin/lichenicidin family type 2 lantibiotic